LQLVDGAIVLSATDLNNYLACGHLTALDLSVLRQGLARPQSPSGQAGLLAELGEAHERGYLELLRRQNLRRAIVSIDRSAGISAAAAATERAMADGAEIVYQATFFDGTWLGHADFLRRVDEQLPGGRWPWHYEVEDTKLARQTEPYFLLQLCYYSEHVERVQGVAPRSMYVVLGDGTRHRFAVDEFAAYYRSAKQRFLADLDSHVATYPLPVDQCNYCVWDATCEQRRRKDDHLSLVANMTRLQTERLNGAGISTLAALAAARDDARPPEMVAATYDKLRRQARLQDEQRKALAAHDPDPWKYEFIEAAIEERRGFFLLPEPSPGDLFFDMEGDPYYELGTGTGLEYLFGAYTADGSWHAFWGCDRSERPTGADRPAEKRAFEEFVKFVMQRREAFPGMHVYHYASYEKTALQKLSQRHATCEEEIATILREEVLVDLYRVVRQALVVGQPSYSIKKIEEYYGKRGDASGVKAGDESILWFEEWRALRFDPARRNDRILDDLEIYNKYDCVSTFGLRDWLLSLRTAAAEKFGCEIPPYGGKPVDAEAIRKDPKYAELMDRLDAKIPEDFDPALADPQLAAVRLLFLARHMLEYHYREERPVWWKFHDRCDTYQEDPALLVDDAETIVGLEWIASAPVQSSIAYTGRFPAQLRKIDDGTAYDPRTKASVGTITSVDDGDEYGTIVLKRGKGRAHEPLPPAVTVRKIVYASTVLDAIARFAEALLASGAGCSYRAAYDVLSGAAPRLRGRPPGGTIQPEVVNEDSVRAVVDALDDSYLFVQGPPGAGKTYLGARLIVDLIDRGTKVGITANSHKAIHNLLDEVEAVAAERNVAFRGVKRSNKDEPETRYDSAHFESVEGSLACDAECVAGTAWAFGPDAMDQRLDYLFVDEAGQVALPVAIAVMTAARNVVLLGDPLQLAQVTHTEHPGGVGASVLEHVLGSELRPVAPNRGILLTDSYRMHPDVCGFISGLLYEGKLHAAPARERQAVDSPGLSGTGLRWIPVRHAHNKQRSPEEARAIGDEIERLLQGTVTDVDGITRPLRTDDVIVVSPYNAQVQCIRRELDSRPGCAGVEVGTVDKFQGREAYVVFFSTAASSPEDAPRGARFIFDRQRFNVAISRARALAVMVGSPELLVHRCASIEDVRVANGVCRFIEVTAPQASRHERALTAQ